MKILKSVKRVVQICNEYKNLDKFVGLVVGGFDVLHMGHINLFRLAKKHVDILIVGLDNDKTLKLTKGNSRPINNYQRRSQFLSELTLVDYVFKINKVFKHGDDTSNIYFMNLYKKILPTHVFTHVSTDSLSDEKAKFARKYGIKFVPDKTKLVTHSSAIVAKLESEL